VSENEASELRIGDAERESASNALGEHLSAGRLDVDEYGERTARVVAARTWGELLALFTDLPEPKPRPLTRLGPTTPANRTSPAIPAGGEVAGQHRLPTLGHRLAGAAVPLAAIIATVLFFTVARTWVVFMIIPAAAVLSGALAGGRRHGPHGHRSHGQRDHRGRRGYGARG